MTARKRRKVHWKSVKLFISLLPKFLLKICLFDLKFYVNETFVILSKQKVIFLQLYKNLQAAKKVSIK